MDGRGLSAVGVCYLTLGHFEELDVCRVGCWGGGRLSIGTRSKNPNFSISQADTGKCQVLHILEGSRKETDAIVAR